MNARLAQHVNAMKILKIILPLPVIEFLDEVSGKN
jgi:hypothetical protein